MSSGGHAELFEVGDGRRDGLLLNSNGLFVR